MKNYENPSIFVKVIAKKSVAPFFLGHGVYWCMYCETVIAVVNHYVCLTFSIGNDFRFEKGIEEMLKCEVHAFDPTYVVFWLFRSFLMKIPSCSAFLCNLYTFQLGYL